MAEQDNPIRQSERKGVRPDFLKNTKTTPVDELKDADKKAGDSMNENAEAGGAGAKNGGPGGLWRGQGLSGDKGKTGKGKGKIKAKKAAPLVTVALLLLFGAIIIIPSIPMLVIGAIDFNLQEALGFSGTSAILEEVGEHVTAEMAANGEFPSGLAGDFAKSGLLVGQVTEAGDFVRTNNYVANIDDTLEVAATGIDYHRYGSEGELAILYGDRVIKADEFVAAVESDPVLYADYSNALDITARFYYSEEVAKVYDDLGVSRDAFSDWESTGNMEEDMDNYYAKVQEILGSDSGGVSAVSNYQNNRMSAEMAGCNSDGTGCSSAAFTENGAISGASKAAGKGPAATEKASQLLNMAISSTEPQQAARAFMAIEEPIQRARLDGSGPINQVMTMLNRRVDASYIDVNTKQCVSQNKSILETPNFVAAISGGAYSQEEANNFSRDRALVAADTINSNEIGRVISNSTLGDSDPTTRSAVLERNTDGDAVNREAIAQVKGSVIMSTSDFTVDTLSSVVGGNRAVAGGSYLSNTINLRTLGGMPSDEAAVANYQHEVDTVLARKANAERATLSPFDISSPNTFLGSIAHSFASAYIKNSPAGGADLASMVGVIANATKSSADSLTGGAMADGTGSSYAMTNGNCATVNQAANVVGDVYCNSHDTLSTKYIERTQAEWEDVKNSQGFKDFVKYGMGREATVGVKSEKVCEDWNNDHLNDPDVGPTVQAIEALRSVLNSFGMTFSVCTAVDALPEGDGISDGSFYTLSDSNANNANAELYSGYALYDEVYSLMSAKQSEVSKIKEEFYKENPKDSSAAGRIARYSGMSRADAEIALGYASYLALVENYDASARFAFGRIDIEHPIVIIDDEKIKETIYGFWQGKMEFADLRNRNQVA